jgi:protein tyrosine phosphatase
VNESRVLRHYQYVEWTEDAVPPNSTAVIDLIGVLQKAQHQNGGGPIVLHDSTPIGRAGTFCVLSSVLEQLKVEGVVDIFFFVHALRQQQPGLVATFEQYKFCYSSVLEFLVSFELYSNFD